MKAILQELTILPGVAGTCILHRQGELSCAQLPAQLTPDKLKDVSRQLFRLFQMGTNSDLDLKSIALRFEQFIFMATILDTDTLLITVCKPDGNCSLVAATASMLREDLRQELSKNDGIEEMQIIDIEEAEQKAKAHDKSNDSQELTALFEEIRKTFAFFVGPAAGIIMEEQQKHWRDVGPAHQNRITELIALLAMEIPDSALAKEFQDKVDAI